MERAKWGSGLLITSVKPEQKILPVKKNCFWWEL